MNRSDFLRHIGLGALVGLTARGATTTTGLVPGAPDTADAVPVEPSLSKDAFSPEVEAMLRRDMEGFWAASMDLAQFRNPVDIRKAVAEALVIRPIV